MMLNTRPKTKNSSFDHHHHHYPLTSQPPLPLQTQILSKILPFTSIQKKPRKQNPIPKNTKTTILLPPQSKILKASIFASVWATPNCHRYWYDDVLWQNYKKQNQYFIVLIFHIKKRGGLKKKEMGVKFLQWWWTRKWMESLKKERENNNNSNQKKKVNTTINRHKEKEAQNLKPFFLNFIFYIYNIFFSPFGSPCFTVLVFKYT